MKFQERLHLFSILFYNEKAKKPPEERRRITNDSPDLPESCACVSQAVSCFHSPDRWNFHRITIVRERCFWKNKAVFSDNISRILLEKRGSRGFLLTVTQVRPLRTGQKRKPQLPFALCGQEASKSLSVNSLSQKIPWILPNDEPGRKM